MQRIGMLLAAVVLVVGTTSSEAEQPGKPVKPIQKWSGKFPDNKDLPLKKLAPLKGYFIEEKPFIALWKQWLPNLDAPKIDFDKYIVFVSTGLCAANSITIHFTILDGNLSSKSASSLVAGPGFAFIIVVVPREGVKTINGKPIMK